MVFEQNKPKADTAYLDTTAPIKSPKSNDAVANRYADMIACFDGSPDAYSKALPIIEEIFSSELIISTGEDPKDYQWFKEWAESYSKQRNAARVEHIEPTATGFRVAIRNVVDGVDQGAVAQLGTVVGGKITYWSADLNGKDKAGFDRLVTSVAANQNGVAGNIQRLRDYLAALDGSPDAFERFEPHIDRVLSKDLVWENDEGEKMNYDEIIELIRDKYIPNGCYPVLDSVEVNEDGRSLTVVINNHLPGEDGDATRQVLYYGDDDLIYRLVSSGLYNTCQRIGSLPTK